MSEQHQKQTFGLPEEEYRKLYGEPMLLATPGKAKQVKKDKSDAEIVRLLEKLEKDHALDALERAKLRELVKSSGYKLPSAYADYIGTTSHSTSSTWKYFAGLFLVVALIMTGMVFYIQTIANEQIATLGQEKTASESALAAEKATSAALQKQVTDLTSQVTALTNRKPTVVYQPTYTPPKRTTCTSSLNYFGDTVTTNCY